MALTHSRTFDNPTFNPDDLRFYQDYQTEQYETYFNQFQSLEYFFLGLVDPRSPSTLINGSNKTITYELSSSGGVMGGKGIDDIDTRERGSLNGRSINGQITFKAWESVFEVGAAELLMSSGGKPEVISAKLDNLIRGNIMQTRHWFEKEIIHGNSGSLGLLCPKAGQAGIAPGTEETNKLTVVAGTDTKFEMAISELNHGQGQVVAFNHPTSGELMFIKIQKIKISDFNGGKTGGAQAIPYIQDQDNDIMMAIGGASGEFLKSDFTPFEGVLDFTVPARLRTSTFESKISGGVNVPEMDRHWTSIHNIVSETQPIYGIDRVAHPELQAEVYENNWKHLDEMGILEYCRNLEDRNNILASNTFTHICTKGMLDGMFSSTVLDGKERRQNAGTFGVLYSEINMNGVASFTTTKSCPMGEILSLTPGLIEVVSAKGSTAPIAEHETLSLHTERKLVTSSLMMGDFAAVSMSDCAKFTQIIETSPRFPYGEDLQPLAIKSGAPGTGIDHIGLDQGAPSVTPAEIDEQVAKRLKSEVARVEAELEERFEAEHAKRVETEVTNRLAAKSDKNK